MARVKHGPASKARHKKVLAKTKGYFLGRRTLYKKAVETLRRAWVYAYRDRRNKKRTFRNLWVLRINAACRENGIIYSKFINGLKKAKVNIDRKILADLAVTDTAAFKKLIDISKA